MVPWCHLIPTSLTVSEVQLHMFMDRFPFFSSELSAQVFYPFFYPVFAHSFSLFLGNLYMLGTYPFVFDRGANMYFPSVSLLPNLLLHTKHRWNFGGGDTVLLT